MRTGFLRPARLWPGAASVALGLGLLGIVNLAARGENERVVEISAMKFSYTPDTITLKKGEPVTLELYSTDRLHGFDVPGLKVRADITAEGITKVHLVPKETGRFLFHCDNFCGDGHEDMQGVIIVTD